MKIPDLQSFQKIQNICLRKILGLPFTTPVPYLHLLTNQQTIYHRYYYYMVKHLLRTYKAPPNHPLTQYYQQYLHLINLLQNKQYTKHQYPSKTNIPSIFNALHPIPIAHKVLKYLNHPLRYTHSPSQLTCQPYRALPLFQIDKPPILRIHTKEINKDPPIFPGWTIAYCDGSNITNPGKGASAALIIQSPITTPAKPYELTHTDTIPYDIGYNEMKCYKMILEHYLNYPKFLFPKLIIYSDSITSMELLNQTSKPTSFTIQYMIEHIYKCIWSLLNRNGIKYIFIKKVKGHGNCTWHNQVDKLATKTAQTNKLNPNHNHRIPYYIHMQYLKQSINQLRNKEWHQYRSKKDHMNNYLESTFTHHDPRLLKYLNFFRFHNRQIIANVITNQTKTNEYYHRFGFANPHKYNYGTCSQCNQFQETIDHIIYICPAYYKQRQQFFQSITKEFPIYGNKYISSKTCNILFPWKNKTITQSIKNIPYTKYINKHNNKPKPSAPMSSTKYNKTLLTITIWTKLIHFLKSTKQDIFIYNKYTKSKSQTK